MGMLGWIAALVLAWWAVERFVLRTRQPPLRDAPGAKKVSGAVHGIADALPMFGGQRPFEPGDAPPPGALEDDLGDHRIEIEPPTRPTVID